MCTSFVINKEKTLVGWNLDIFDMIHKKVTKIIVAKNIYQR